MSKIDLNQIKGGKELKNDMLKALVIWNPKTKYAKEQTVLLGTKIYKCKTENQDEEFDEAKWIFVTELTTNNFATNEDIDSLFE